MASNDNLAGVEALATRVKQLLWVVLDSVPAELVPWSLMLVRLLHAADTFPRGGLYDGHYAAQAALRYEIFWLPLAARAQRSRRGQVLIPPLDVAMVWLLHRCTAPGSYPADCEALLGAALDTPSTQAFRFAGAHAYSQCESPEERQAWASREVWDAAYVHGHGAFDLYSATPASTAPGSEVSSPRPELGGPQGARGGGGGSWSGGGRRSKRFGSRGGYSTGSEMGGSQGSKLAAAAAGSTGSAAGEGSMDGSSGGGSRLQAQFWPPAPRGAQWDLTRLCPLVRSAGSGAVGGGSGAGSGSGVALGRGRLAGLLAGRMSELCPLLHSLLRPAYLDPDVLAQAVQRYCRFLMLQGVYPSVPMVPTTDIALMWAAHMAVPAAYRDTCRRLLGRTVLPAPGALRLDDSGPEFAETRRLYEHHFGEVYDPPLTRAVPLSTPHPLLSSPLAPFLPAFEVSPTGTPDLVLAAAYFGADADPSTGVLPSPTVQQLQQQRSLGNGGFEYGNGDGCGGGLHRCGAHALYLAYLLRRGGNRTSRNLLGLMLGQAHRRRAAVKYVANKAAGFRDFLHLPDSDCHAYWRKLRLRHVDPESVPSGAASPSSGGSQLGDVVQEREMDDRYGDAGSDLEADGGGRSDDEAEQHEVVRRALVQAAADAAVAGPCTRSSGGGDGGFLTPLGPSRRVSWMDPSSGTTPVPRSMSLGGSSGDAPDTPLPPPPPTPPPRAQPSISAWQRPKRISLIVPLSPSRPPLPSVQSPTHSTLTFAASSGGPSRPPSERETASGELSERTSRRQQQQGPGPRSSTGNGMAAAASEPVGTGEGAEAAAAPSSSSEAPIIDLAAGLRAAAAAAKEPLVTWAAPRGKPPPPSSQPASEPQTPGSDITLAGDGTLPSSGRRPSIERRKYDDGTDEWAYNNPYYVDRLLELGPLSPLSPLGQTPPPASAAFLAAQAAAAGGTSATTGTSGDAAAAVAAAAAAPGPSETTADVPPPVGLLKNGARGFGGEVWAVRVARPADGADGGGAASDAAATIPTLDSSDAGVAAAAGAAAATLESRESGGGASERLQQVRSGALGEDGGSPAAPGSVYVSYPESRASLEDIDSDDAAVGAATAAVVGGAATKRLSKDGDSSEGTDVYGTPTGAFASAVVTPFSGGRPAHHDDDDDDDDDGDGGGGVDEGVVITAGDNVVAAVSRSSLAGDLAWAAAPKDGAKGGPSSADSAGSMAGGATGSGGGGGGSGSGGGSGGSVLRFTGPLPSRLARVTSTTTPMPASGLAPAPSLPPPPLALTAAHADGTHGGSAATITPRAHGLPPRPMPSALPPPEAGSTPTRGASVSTPKRASGAYGPADASYMDGLGGVASLVTRGEESPVFSKSLRERYTGASGRPSGGGGGPPWGSGGSSAGAPSPMVSSSGASYCSAVSGRSSGGRGAGPPAAGGGSRG